MTGSGSGAPPLVRKRTLLKEAAAKRGDWSMSWYWVGTQKNIVTRSASISASISSADHLRMMTTVPPSVSRGRVYTRSPPVWNMGVWVMVTSPRSSSWTMVLSVFQAIMRYETWAALGWPDVPPVNSRQMMSSASTVSWRTDSSLALARAAA